MNNLIERNNKIQEEVLQKAKELVSVKNQIEGKTIRKIIFIADKLMNIIAN